MVREGKFREDLFMRLNVVQIRVPPLREHKEDIRDIADIWWFEKFRKHLTEEQINALMEYDDDGSDPIFGGIAGALLGGAAGLVIGGVLGAMAEAFKSAVDDEEAAAVV